MTISPPDAATAERVPDRPGNAGRRRVVPAIDGFRGLAALAVLLMHSLMGAGLSRLDEGPIRSIMVSGYMGVDFFFVISGFVLFLPTVVNGGRFGHVGSYAVRRTARIVPAYWVLLVVLATTQPLLTATRTDLPYQSRRGLLSMLLHLTFMQHFVGLLLKIPEGFAIHGAIWTLTLEAMFYVLLPLIAAAYFRRPFAGLLVAVVVSMAWKLAITRVGHIHPKQFSYLRIVLITQLPTYLGHFAAGMTAAWVFVRVRDLIVTPARRAVVVLTQAAAAGGILFGMRAEGIRDLTARNGYYDHFTRPIYIAAMFAVLLLTTALAPPWAQSPVANRVSRRVGDMSYGIYLWHLMFIGFAIKTLGWVPDASNWAFVRMLAFTLPLSLLAGWLSMMFVEQPAVRWARVRSSRMAARPQRDALVTRTISPAGASGR